MDKESETIIALHELYVRLASLREGAVSERRVELPFNYEQTLIEEAYAALSQVETEIEALRAELEYHNQRFEAEKTQQPESGSSHQRI